MSATSMLKVFIGIFLPLKNGIGCDICGNLKRNCKCVEEEVKWKTIRNSSNRIVCFPFELDGILLALDKSE